MTIAPAGSPSAEAPAIKRPAGRGDRQPGRGSTNQPLTLTARVSDPSLAGTVQFFAVNGNAIGTPVPVVTASRPARARSRTDLQQVFARFEPAADR